MQGALNCRFCKCIYRPCCHSNASHVSRLFDLFEYLSVLHEFRIVENVGPDRRHQ